MKFKRPEKALAEHTREELEEQRASAVERRNEISKLTDEELDTAALDEFDEIVAFLGEIDTTVQAIDAEEADLVARREALRSYQEPEDATDEEPEPTGDGDEAGDETDNPDDVVIPDDASDLVEEREPVTASARRGAAGKAARQAPKQPVDDTIDVEPEPKVAITAAAGVRDFDSGQALADFRELSKAFQSRASGWSRTVTKAEMDRKPSEVMRLSKTADQRGVGRIDMGAHTEFDSRGMATAEQFDLVMKAANEQSRFGKRGGLIAAGGWCAPSETIYDGFLTLETLSGILDLPTVTADRGGINFTKGPDYASIASTFGFMQTEAQAELGTEKDCYEVACPPFSEVRLDAIGFCITAGILTEAAYPELIDRVLQIGAVAHGHKVNASVISRILGYIGSAVDHVELGSATADLLDAAELQVMRLRYTYAMAPDATVEAFLPVWAIAIFRADLARRNGVDSWLAISQADVEGWFRVRGINVQWVYDWQPFTAAATTPAAGAAWTSLPDTLEMVIYPAGSYVKLTTNVINLDAIYDSVNTKTNTFTAAFFEEGIAVANTGAAGIRVSVSVTDLYGRSGAAELAAA